MWGKEEIWRRAERGTTHTRTSRKRGRWGRGPELPIVSFRVFVSCMWTRSNRRGSVVGLFCWLWVGSCKSTQMMVIPNAIIFVQQERPAKRQQVSARKGTPDKIQKTREIYTRGAATNTCISPRRTQTARTPRLSLRCSTIGKSRSAVDGPCPQ